MGKRTFQNCRFYRLGMSFLLIWKCSRDTDNLQLIVKLKNLSVYLELAKKCSESGAIPTRWIDDIVT
jgi:hypothetical protein